MSDNPYASPAVSDAVRVPQSTSDQIATRGQRFVNLFIDNIVVQVLSYPVGMAFGLFYVALIGDSEGMITQDQESTMLLLSFVVGILFTLTYFVVSEALWQKTPAKFITKTMVVTTDGGKPSVKQIIGRSLARMIPFEAFSFLSGSNPVGWHDSMSGTRVIDTKTSGTIV